MTNKNKIHYDLTRILKPLPASRGEKLILIHGSFHSQNFRGKDFRAWTRSCRRAGFRGEISGFSWESFDYGSLLEDFANGLADVARKGIRGTPDLAGRILQGSRKRWLDSKAKAVDAGEELAGRINSLGDPEKVILMGHSLGCRTIKTCLEKLAEQIIEIKEVHLLGAAVPASESWARASRAVRGEITNYYSKNDAILQIPYHAAELFSGLTVPGKKDRALPTAPRKLLNPPAGLKGIRWSGKKLKNIDVSSFVNRHAGFEENLNHFINF